MLMKKRLLTLALAAIMALGLAVPAMAYTTSDFTDVPQNHWAYDSVMKMADAGVIKGTGGGMFSPDMKLSAEMFIVLVGRVVFSDLKAEGSDWSGPYVYAAKMRGMLDGTVVTDETLVGEISRYDMAVILAKAAEILDLKADKANSSKVTDYTDIPSQYTDAVLWVYGAGLIKGDQAGNFNGSNSMTRQEAATVIDRLLALMSGVSPSVSGTNPEGSVEIQEMALRGWIQYGTKGNPVENGIGIAKVPFQLRYTEDNGATYQVIAEEVTQDKYYGSDYPGYFSFTARVEKPTFDKFWNGEGLLYISTEATVNGQRYVTQDRRTDGKATIVPISDWSRVYVDLVPPDRGETIDIDIVGTVIANTAGVDENGHKWYHANEETITNSTVKIYYDRQQAGVPRVLIAETTADGGRIDGTITIDTAYYYPTGDYYFVEIQAVVDGQLCTNHRQQQEKPISMAKLTRTESILEMKWFIDSEEALAY